MLLLSRLTPREQTPICLLLPGCPFLPLSRPPSQVVHGGRGGGPFVLTQPFSLSFSLTAVNECPVTSPSSPCRHRRPSGVSFPTLSLSLSPPFGLVIDSRQGSAVVVDQGRRCGGAPLPPFYPSLPLSLVVSCGGWVEKTPLAHVLLAKKAKVA